MPFFSIGVTTYNRIELLKETLQSILSQSFQDFEIIVGNDYVQKPITLELLGIHDARISIINHPENLGEAGNMNYLMSKAKGRYFSWFADDDIYDGRYLELIFQGLKHYAFPKCAYSSFCFLDSEKLIYEKSYSQKAYIFSGKDFLVHYSQDQIKVVPVYGMFDIDFIRGIGGIEKVCNAPYALYAEYLLILQTGILDKILYIDLPLIHYRRHQGSWGQSNEETNLFIEAGEKLFSRSLDLIKSTELVQDVTIHINNLLRMHLNNVRGKYSITGELYRKWIGKLLLDGVGVSAKLASKGVKSAVVYGTGESAVLLNRDLTQSGIAVIAHIGDNTKSGLKICGSPVCTLGEIEIEKFDCCVISAETSQGESAVRQLLQSAFDKPVLSLKDLIIMGLPEYYNKINQCMI